MFRLSLLPMVSGGLHLSPLTNQGLELKSPGTAANGASEPDGSVYALCD